MNGPGFFMRVVIFCLKNKTMIICVFGFSEQIVLQFVRFYFIISFSIEETLLPIQPDDLLFPDFKIIAPGEGLSRINSKQFFGHMQLPIKISNNHFHMMSIVNKFLIKTQTFEGIPKFDRKLTFPFFVLEFLFAVFIELFVDDVFAVVEHGTQFDWEFHDFVLLF